MVSELRQLTIREADALYATALALLDGGARPGEVRAALRELAGPGVDPFCAWWIADGAAAVRWSAELVREAA